MELPQDIDSCHRLIRDLLNVIDRQQEQLKQNHEALVAMEEEFRSLTARVKELESQLLEKAEAEEPSPQKRPRGKPKQTKGRNLLDRLLKHQEAVLAFAWHPEVPFTNNQAERDIRPTKTKNKVSGCFRTEAGAHIYARIQSFISTVRKLQLNPFNELCTVLSGGTPAYRLETT